MLKILSCSYFFIEVGSKNSLRMMGCPKQSGK